MINNSTKFYNSKKINFLNEPMFLGSGRNSQRFDILKYPFFDTMADNMMGQEWSYNEIQVSKDLGDFRRIDDGMKHILTATLQKLIFLDSVQGRGILQTLGNIITLPEVEAAFTVWEHFELNKHSKSYTYILRTLYANPSKIFDDSFNIPELKKLTRKISTPYNEVGAGVASYMLGNKKGVKKLKLDIVKLFIEIYFLEGVRFYSGFAAIWGMHYFNGLFERTSKLLQLICRDENLHYNISYYVLKLLGSVEEEGFKNEIMDEYFIPLFKKRLEEVKKEEFLWIDYLMKEGCYMGINGDILKMYIEYLFYIRGRKFIKNMGGVITENPIPWVESYINMAKNEVLPQEGEVINYNMDILDMRINDSEIEELRNEYNKCN